MTDREKLIEVLIKQVGYTLPVFTATQTIELLADCLIAHGMTFAKDTDVPSKWISVEERKPIEEWKKITSESEAELFPCLCCRWNNHYRSKRYVTKLYFDGEYFIDLYGVILDEFITHWMPLPEPPRVQGVPNGTDHV